VGAYTAAAAAAEDVTAIAVALDLFGMYFKQ
jgi:hypothetical protein